MLTRTAQFSFAILSLAIGLNALVGHLYISASRQLNHEPHAALEASRIASRIVPYRQESWANLALHSTELELANQAHKHRLRSAYMDAQAWIAWAQSLSISYFDNSEQTNLPLTEAWQKAVHLEPHSPRVAQQIVLELLHRWPKLNSSQTQLATDLLEVAKTYRTSFYFFLILHKLDVQYCNAPIARDTKDSDWCKRVAILRRHCTSNPAPKLQTLCRSHGIPMKE